MTPTTDDELEATFRTALDDGNTAHIATLAAAIDHRDTPAPVPTLLASALWYAEQNLPVFPLQPGAKIPLKGSRGCKDATTDTDRIRTWWDTTPEANIGLATGHLVDVVDIDGPTGQQSRANLWDSTFERIDHDALAKVLTPRPGGMHIYVPTTGDGNGAGIAPGVDYRGRSGYVVAPPSVLDDRPGQHAGRYRFLGVPRLTDLAKSVA